MYLKMWHQILQILRNQYVVDWMKALGSLMATAAALAIAVWGDQMRAAHPNLRVTIDHDDRDDCHKTRWRVPVRVPGRLQSEPRLTSQAGELAQNAGTHTEAKQELRVHVPFQAWGTASPRFGGQYDQSIYVSPETPGERTEWRYVDVYYMRLNVENKGKKVAQGVEVYATELRRRQADRDTYERVKSFQSMNLLWSHYRTVLLGALSPDMPKHCDLAHIIDPKHRKNIPGEHTTIENVGEDKAILSFDTAVMPYNWGHLARPGDYELDIVVGAANAEPKPETVRISVTGTWSDYEEKMFGPEVTAEVV